MRTFAIFPNDRGVVFWSSLPTNRNSHSIIFAHAIFSKRRPCSKKFACTPKRYQWLMAVTYATEKCRRRSEREQRMNWFTRTQVIIYSHGLQTGQEWSLANDSIFCLATASMRRLCRMYRLLCFVIDRITGVFLHILQAKTYGSIPSFVTYLSRRSSSVCLPGSQLSYFQPSA